MSDFCLFCLSICQSLLFLCPFSLSFPISSFCLSVFYFLHSLLLSSCYSKNQVSWSWCKPAPVFQAVPLFTLSCSLSLLVRQGTAVDGGFKPEQLPPSAQHSTPPAAPPAPPTEPDSQHCLGTGPAWRYVLYLVQ